jgi:hypothetical protein
MRPAIVGGADAGSVPAAPGLQSARGGKFFKKKKKTIFPVFQFHIIRPYERKLSNCDITTVSAAFLDTHPCRQKA